MHQRRETYKDIIQANLSKLYNQICSCDLYYRDGCMLEKGVRDKCRLYRHGCRYMPLFEKYIRAYRRRANADEIIKRYDERIMELFEGKKKKGKKKESLEKKVL